MAFVVEDVVELRLSFVDDGGTRSTTSFCFPTANVTWGNVLAFAQTAAAASQAVSDASLDSFSVHMRAIDHNALAAGSASDVSRVGAFIFHSLPDTRYVLVVPSLITSVLMTTGNFPGIEIDQTDTAVFTLVDLMLGGNGTVRPVDHQHNPLSSLAVAYKQYRPTVTYVRKG